MYNKVILIGRMTTDAEMKTTESGVNVARFRVAVDRPHQKEKERRTDFINIVAWRHLAEFVCKYFGKGKLIGIEGRIQTGDYTDRDGNKRYTFDVRADRLFFVGNKEKTDAKSGEEVPEGFTEISDDEDLPF